MRLRALVLAAGRGERLRPLTERCPKPLLPVLGRPILAHTLDRLAAAGVESTAINLHHLGEQIPALLGERAAGMPISYSSEEQLLGTLGPLARLGDVLADSDPVLLVNGDSLCRWPVDAILEAHRERGAGATLLLSSRADPGRFGGGVVVDDRGRVLSFRGERQESGTRCGVFAGFHAISSRLLVGIEERPSDVVRDLYEPQLATGTFVQGVFTDRRWHDLGTPRRYLDGVLDEVRSLDGAASWRHDTARIDSSAEISSTAIEAGAVVERRALVVDSLVMNGARIGPGCRVNDSIVGPGVVVAPDSHLESQLLTVTAAGSVLFSAL